MFAFACSLFFIFFYFLQSSIGLGLCLPFLLIQDDSGNYVLV